MARKLAVVLVAALATLMTTAAAKGSHPKTLTVGQQSASCPNPGYERIGDAIEDAAPGDTIAICPGTYAEGPGTPGTSVLTIHKDLTLRGAGADQVTIEPRSVADGLGAPFAGRWTLAIAKRLLHEIVLLDDATILAGMRFALERLKQVVEPAGAAALAAVLAGRVELDEGERVVVVLSGGNVEVGRLGELIAAAGMLPGNAPA